MKVFSGYILLFLLSGIIFSCKPSKICPAYHSYFILDPDVTRTTFSLFGADSLPKDPKSDLWQIDKKKVGIADDIAYRKKLRKQAIISMESVYLKKEDPFENQLAMAEMDSAMIDSLQQVRLDNQYQDFYNYDQIIYLHYFGEYLPKPKPNDDIRDDLEPEEETMISDDEQPAEVEPEEKKGFFKRLFGKKKNKDKKEVSQEDEESVGDDDPIDEEEDDNFDNY